VDTAQRARVIRVREAAALQKLLLDLAKDGVFIHAVEPRRPSLEEHFVQTIQGDAR
jgi:hypothetical protein